MSSFSYADIPKVNTQPTLVYAKDITGVMDAKGIVTTSGTMYMPEFWKTDRITEIIIPEDSQVGNFLLANSRKLTWQDIMAFMLVVKNRGFNKYVGKVIYLAGDRQLDTASLVIIAREIVNSNGSQSWNSIITRKNVNDPIPADDTTQVDSPFNPKSPFFDPKKPIFTYDPDNGYILYKSGEIVWSKTGKRYFERSQVVSYDKLNHTVTFENGVRLNLNSLERISPDNQVTVVKNELPWYQDFFRKVLSDTKTQFMVIGALVLILFIKSKRKNGK